MKYELTKETVPWMGRTLYRIRATASFGIVIKGELGGFIESDKNLSTAGDAWVYGNARVWGDAQVYGNAQVWGDAQVYGNARVWGNAQVYGDAQVWGDAQVCGNAQVYGDAQAIISPINVIGLPHIITITDAHIAIGCNLFTHAEFRKLTAKKAAELGSTAVIYRRYHKLISGLLTAILKDRRAK